MSDARAVGAPRAGPAPGARTFWLAWALGPGALLLAAVLMRSGAVDRRWGIVIVLMLALAHWSAAIAGVLCACVAWRQPEVRVLAAYWLGLTAGLFAAGRGAAPLALAHWTVGLAALALAVPAVRAARLVPAALRARVTARGAARPR